MKVLLNGQPIDRNQAVISAFDHGFLYGMGLFETFRTYGGRPWLLDRHAERLARGCSELGIRYEPDVARMESAVKELLAANGLEDGYIRWSISAGEGEIGLPAGEYGKPNEIVYAKELAPDDPVTRKGKTLRLLKLPRSTPEVGLRLKSFHYMNNIVAKRELLASGASPGTEGLFLDGNGRVAEGMVSNVFWATKGRLYTPDAETGLLEGITREYVIRMAGAAGQSVEEGLYRWGDLLNADEVFVTNSIQEIVPVTTLENEFGEKRHPGGKTETGPLTSMFMTQYRAAAERKTKPC
ncbi:aminodeoxychorismate lyase [Cohnella terricola]|uniref:Aminodeoxychorismate lyase n=1 Tax=Cohnella terricola TaxID=1289167 RepID=A0A559J7F9_9BACL|nr:aminodeoxychorismate lyase [Cohnella terricola]TVX95820.1 aminodeoxychorismate lyase [Cohnella terricola]